MKVKLKALQDQAIVITGATSGIGLTTARMAAERGAALVLAARSQDELQQLVQEIKSRGGEAVGVIADVGREEDVRAIARQATEAFGGFDTWVNNAGVGMYGKLEHADVEDMRHLFETNFWGLVYGSLEAVKHLRERGGALINVGSMESDRAVPLHGAYTASKQAAKGFTDVLRMELEHDGLPVAVTLIKPGAIDTPFPLNAKSDLASEPQHSPPVYAPETVARAILHCAETPVRELYVGASGAGAALLERFAPRLADKFMEATMFDATESGRPRRPREENALDHPSHRLESRGNYPGHVARSSVYTQASMHPVLTSMAVVGLGLALGALLSGRGYERAAHVRASRHPSA